MKNIKAKKPTLAKKVSITKAKKPLANKKVAKKRIISKSLKTNKLATKKLSYKKTPIKRVSSQKRVKLSKPFGITVMLSGLAALVLLFVFGLPAILNPDSGEKPVLGVTANGVPVNPAFTDPNFYACVLDNLNSNKVEGRSNRTYGYYTTAREMALLKTLICSGSAKSDNLKITNTNGLELFSGLQSLNVESNKISYIDISNNLNLVYAYLQHNIIADISVSENTVLGYIDISYNQLTDIDVTTNISLVSLDVGQNRLSNLDITNNTQLTDLRAFNNQLTSIDISNNIKLNMLILSGNQLNSIDVTKNTGLYYLDIGSNKLKDIDVTENTPLEDLRVYSNQLTNIDVTKNTSLTVLGIDRNQLTTLDVTKNTRLYTLTASNNQLSSVDITNNPELRYLSVSYNQIKSLDVTKNVALTMIEIRDNQLTSLNILNNPKLDVLVLWNNPLIALKAVSSSKYLVSFDNNTVSTNDTDIATFLAGIVPSNSLITTGVYRNNVAVSSGKLLKGDKLRVSVKNDSKYYNYQIVLPAVPTVLSYGNLASSIDVAKGILYRRYLSFVSSVDVSQIKVQQGDATITSAFMAYSDGSLIRSKHAFLKNGNKLIIKLSDGTTTEFVVKTAWSW